MDMKCPSCRSEVLVVDGELLPEYTCSVCGHEFALSSEPDFARLLISDGQGNTLSKDVLRGATLIGSAEGCNIRLVDAAVSPVHCILTLEAMGICARDLRSQTGTRVNGSLVEVRMLCDGDHLSIGEFEFKLETNLLNQMSRARAASQDADFLLRRPGDGPDSNNEDGDESRPFLHLDCRGIDQSVRKNIYRPTTLIGSGDACHIRLRSPQVADVHCVLTVEAEGVRVRDLRTVLGTNINGSRVNAGWLSDGDEIAVGEFSFKVRTNLKPNSQSRHLATSPRDPNEFE